MDQEGHSIRLDHFLILLFFLLFPLHYFDPPKVRLVQERGNRVTPKNKMFHATEIEDRTTRVLVLDPPIRGNACFEVFLGTNKLFDTLMHNNKPETPGKPDAACDKEHTQMYLYCYTFFSQFPRFVR